MVSLDTSGRCSKLKDETCLNIHFKNRIHRVSLWYESVSSINVVHLSVPHKPG